MMEFVNGFLTTSHTWKINFVKFVFQSTNQSFMAFGHVKDHFRIQSSLAKFPNNHSFRREMNPIPTWKAPQNTSQKGDRIPNLTWFCFFLIPNFVSGHRGWSDFVSVLSTGYSIYWWTWIKSMVPFTSYSDGPLIILCQLPSSKLT